MRRISPLGLQPPTAPVLGDWQPLPNAGATTHTTERLLRGMSYSDWAIRIVLVAVMTAALAVGTWSIYTLLTQVFHVPGLIAVLGCGMFDGAALRWRSAVSAALAPHMPCAPGPGGVAAEQMYMPGIPVS